MMTKFKHNKKRNTAFIYECLVIELTKAVLGNDKNSQSNIKSIIKEHFKKDSALLNDLKTYQAITETKDVAQDTAAKILEEAKKQKSSIDSKQLFNEQNKVINKINKSLSTNFFSNFIPNYKDLASVSQIFNTSVPIKSRVLLEQEVIGAMSKTEEEKQEMLPVDSLTYKIFTQKFNEQYSDSLLEEQKALLEKYISSFKDNGLELKIHLDQEIGRLKEEIQQCSSNNVIQENEMLKQKLSQVSEILNGFASQAPNEEMLTKVISIQSLVKEIQEDVN
jgi:hypothetical protein